MADMDGQERRQRILMLLGVVVLAALAIGGYAWRHNQSSSPPDPRLVQIQHVLDTEQTNQLWYPTITGLEIKDHKLYVHTKLPGRDWATPDNESPNYHLTQPMYNALWKYTNMDHPSWSIGWVYIMSRYGTHIDGGAA